MSSAAATNARWYRAGTGQAGEAVACIRSRGAALLFGVPPPLALANVALAAAASPTRTTAVS